MRRTSAGARRRRQAARQCEGTRPTFQLCSPASHAKQQFKVFKGVFVTWPGSLRHCTTTGPNPWEKTRVFKSLTSRTKVPLNICFRHKINIYTAEKHWFNQLKDAICHNLGLFSPNKDEQGGLLSWVAQKNIFRPIKSRRSRSFNLFFSCLLFSTSSLFSLPFCLSAVYISLHPSPSPSLSLSPCLCFIQQKTEKPHHRVSGRVWKGGREKKRREELKTKCRRELERGRVCDVAE